MKALSFTQPWASLVAAGAKKIETRSWSHSHRGWLAIHASKTFPEDCRVLCLIEPFRSALLAAGVPVWPQGPRGTWRNFEVPNSDELPLGAIVAVAILCHVGEIRQNVEGTIYLQGKDWCVTGDELAFGDYTPGRYGWAFGRSLFRLPEPIPCKGKLGLWDVPAEIVEQIRAQLGDIPPLQAHLVTAERSRQ